MLEHLHAAATTGQSSDKEAVLGYMASYYDLVTWLMAWGKEKALRRKEVELALLEPDSTVLEVGCGTGSLTLAAQARLAPAGRVVGIDAAPQMIAVARRKAAKARLDINFQVGRIQEIPYPDDSFDRILCSFMIFHMSEGVRRKGFSEIRRVLKPGGRLLLVDTGMPSRVWQQRLMKKFMAAMLEHELTELIPLMQQAGFTQIESGPAGFDMVSYLRGKIVKS